MSKKNQSVIRPELPDGVENMYLPKWDKDGNDVSKNPPKPKPQKVSEKVDDVTAEEIKIPTVKELEAIQESAYNEGFEQGYQSGLVQGTRDGKTEGLKAGKAEGIEAGLQEGREAGQQQALAEEQKITNEKLLVLGSISEELKKQLPQEQKELEQALLALSIRIARQVLQDEIKANPQHIESIVHAAVQSLPNPDNKLSVSVNPNDFELVTQFADSHWQIHADEKITTGGCEIKSGYSYIDFTLEHRFDLAVSHFLSHLGEGVKPDAIQSPFTSENLIDVASSAQKQLDAAEAEKLIEKPVSEEASEVTQSLVEGSEVDNRDDNDISSLVNSEDETVVNELCQGDAVNQEKESETTYDQKSTSENVEESSEAIVNFDVLDNSNDGNESVSESQESRESDNDKTTTD